MQVPVPAIVLFTEMAQSQSVPVREETFIQVPVIGVLWIKINYVCWSGLFYL
jgi:hypothetical protein